LESSGRKVGGGERLPGPARLKKDLCTKYSFDAEKLTKWQGPRIKEKLDGYAVCGNERGGLRKGRPLQRLKGLEEARKFFPENRVGVEKK